jgi:hypothetical protein
MYARRVCHQYRIYFLKTISRLKPSLQHIIFTVADLVREAAPSSPAFREASTMMRGTPLPIYRLPTATSTQIGRVGVVTDRNNQHYVNGSRVLSATPSGDFQILTLANGEIYYVKTSDYAALPAARRRRR